MAFRQGVCLLKNTRSKSMTWSASPKWQTGRFSPPPPPPQATKATSLHISIHLALGFSALLYLSKSDSTFSIRLGIASEFHNPSFIALLLCGELPSIWHTLSTAVSLRGQLSYIIVYLVQVKLKHNNFLTSMVFVGPKQMSIFPEYSWILRLPFWNVQVTYIYLLDHDRASLLLVK